MEDNRYARKPSRPGNGNTDEEKFQNDQAYKDKMEIKSLVEHIFEGSHPASKSGMVYYKFLFLEMEKEMKKLQTAINGAESEMITQKQNIKELIYEKNKVLTDFHEQFRKFSQKIEYENKMEEEIEHLVKFLDELMPLYSDEINYVKSSENNIRNYLFEKYQHILSELQPLKDALEKEVEELQFKLNEFVEWKAEWETHVKLKLDISNLVGFHQEKLNHLKWSLKNDIADNERIRNEGERIQMITDAEILEKRQTLKNNATKIQQAFHSVKAEFSGLNNIRNEMNQVERNIAKYNDMLFKNEQKLTEIEQQILQKKIKAKEVLDNFYIRIARLRAMEEKKKIEIEKEYKLIDNMYQYRQKIADEEIKMTNQLIEERAIAERRDEVLAEIFNQKRMIASFEMQNTLANERSQNENLTKDITDLKQKTESAKNDLFESKSELESKTKTIAELKKDLLSKKMSVGEELSDKNLYESYLTVENEENVASESVDEELDALLEEISQQQPHIENLKRRLEELLAEKLILDQELVKKQNLLQQKMNSIKYYESSILALKQNVYQGKYVTVQELSKQVTTLSVYAKAEQDAIEKLKEEIAMLIETGKRRRLLNPEKQQDDSARTTRTSRPRKKAEESKNTSDKKNSLKKELFNFFN